jgi:hypothetical protein
MELIRSPKMLYAINVYKKHIVKQKVKRWLQHKTMSLLLSYCLPQEKAVKIVRLIF